MKPSSPWSVKGVEPEAREAAKMAARRAGMPVGAWLSHTIRKVASEQLRSGPGAHAARTQSFSQPLPDGTEPRSTARPPAPTTEAVLESINRLAAKLEASEQRTAETLAPLTDKVRNLSDQMEEIKETKSLDSDPLERALARMAERLDQIEDGPRLGGGGMPPRDTRRRQGFFSRLFSD